MKHCCKIRDLSQHRANNFPVILPKTTLEHNKVTLKIKSARSYEVSNLIKYLSVVSNQIPLFGLDLKSETPQNGKLR